MIDLFTLGDVWVSDFIKKDEIPVKGKHELSLVLEEDTGAVRLKEPMEAKNLFGKYFYKSGVNEQMVHELKNIVESILQLVKVKDNDIFCDLASNDGTLLSFVPHNLIRIGIDPVEDLFRLEAEKHSDLIIQDFFSSEVFKKSKFGEQKCKIITAIAVFYDIDNPDKFLKDVYDILDDDGLFVMQLSHSGLMIEQCAFDNILSEHVYYHCLNSVKVYLERNRFKIVDCQLNETNGGSFRVYIRKQNANDKLFATQAYRDVCHYRINSLLLYEKMLKIDSYDTWILFFNKINELKNQTVTFIKEIKSKGKSIWGYCASTKGNTLLNYFDLDNTIIDGIAERSTFKWGLKTAGTNIPIYSEDTFRKRNPDYVIILAWHFISGFIEREREYLANGGKFIVIMPKFEIITA